ncbi:MAG: hypothetical protein K9G76_01390 [Bacteroidales bacterium]|nr:hypothetical protein [Bacteroidales bacterium]MCF8403206.1 hypothetical protein [Bacteroidales bacterium]
MTKLLIIDSGLNNPEFITDKLKKNFCVEYAPYINSANSALYEIYDFQPDILILYSFNIEESWNKLIQRIKTEMKVIVVFFNSISQKLIAPGTKSEADVYFENTSGPAETYNLLKKLTQKKQ